MKDENNLYMVVLVLNKVLSNDIFCSRKKSPPPEKPVPRPPVLSVRERPVCILFPKNILLGSAQVYLFVFIFYY